MCDALGRKLDTIGRPNKKVELTIIKADIDVDAGDFCDVKLERELMRTVVLKEQLWYSTALLDKKADSTKKADSDDI